MSRINWNKVRTGLQMEWTDLMSDKEIPYRSSKPLKGIRPEFQKRLDDYAKAARRAKHVAALLSLRKERVASATPLALRSKA